ncbi:hypothetical protein [Streptomyces chryseus]|uniref:hypothetical protein n=1 Tax=Streptomyces chryseus TaxID=68186 RepID=UPI00110F90EF|nr:hypothetical protein [Streptomyces chryseus]
MRRHGLTHGRRGAATGAAAVVLCLGGVLAACGGGSDDGYVAVGAAGSGSERAPGRAVPPQGEVELVPLDGESARGDGAGREGPPAGRRGADPGDADDTGAPGAGDGSGSATAPPGRGGAPDSGGSDAQGTPGAPGGSGGAGGGDQGSGGVGGGGTPTKPPVTGAPGAPGPPGNGPGGGSPAPPPGPAVLKVGDPLLAPGDKRWCEQVTVPLRNTGGTAVRSGTVTFATHIIGALGVDWGTRTSSQPLPGPIAAGAAVTKTYTVCVDAWRVPLGMRVETQDVTADWT